MKMKNVKHYKLNFQVKLTLKCNSYKKEKYIGGFTIYF